MKTQAAGAPLDAGSTVLDVETGTGVCAQGTDKSRADEPQAPELKSEVAKLVGLGLQQAAKLCEAVKAPSKAAGCAAGVPSVSGADGSIGRRGLERFAEAFVLGGGRLAEILSRSIWSAEHIAAGGGLIQLSWEYEIAYDEEHHIPKAYRPVEMTDQQWDQLSLEEQMGYVHACRKEEVVMVRRDDAPKGFSETLFFDLGLCAEVTCDSYVTTLDDLYAQVSDARRLLGTKGRFHFHVSFPWTEAMRKHADSVFAVFQRGSEYTTYGRLCGKNSWTNEHITAIRTFGLTEIRDGMASGKWGSSEHKKHTLGWRAGEMTSPYNDANGQRDKNRVGFELRSVRRVADVLGLAMSIVESFVRAAVDPRNGLVKFGNLGVPYRVSEIEIGDWIGPETYKRLARLAPDVKAFFDMAACDTCHVKVGEAEIWRLVIAAREQFWRDVRELMKSPDHQKPGLETTNAIREAVTKFCRATRPAWQYL